MKIKKQCLTAVLIAISVMTLSPLHGGEIDLQNTGNEYVGMRICEAPCRCFGAAINPVKNDVIRLIERTEEYEAEMRLMAKRHQSSVARLISENVELKSKLQKLELELQDYRK